MKLDVPAETLSGTPITRLSAGRLAQPAPNPNMPASTPMPRKRASPSGVRCTVHATSRPVAPSRKIPCIASARAIASGGPTWGYSEFFTAAITTTMPRMARPRATCSTSAGIARPIIAPAMELVDATSASGSASRRFASPPSSRRGPAASAPDSATIRPAPRTKSMWNGKKPATMGTKSTPPPTPAGTAMIPSRKQAKKSASGQAHHAISAPITRGPLAGSRGADAGAVGRLHRGQPLLRELHEALEQARVEPLLGIDDGQLAYERRRQRDLHQLAQPNLLHHRRARHDREAEARCHHALQGLRAARLHDDLKGVGGEPVLLEVMVDDLARARAELAADVGVLGERARGDGTGLGQGVLRVADDAQLVVAAEVVHQRGQVRVAFDEAEVEGALGDARLHGFGVADEKARHHGGMARLELPQHLGQQELRDGGARTDQERPRVLAAHLLQSRVELGGQGEDALGVLEGDDAGGCQRDAPLGAVEEAGVELLFQLAHLEGDRRLRHEERLRGPGEGQVLCDGVEYAKAAIGHALSLLAQVPQQADRDRMPGLARIVQAIHIRRGGQAVESRRRVDQASFPESRRQVLELQSQRAPRGLRVLRVVRMASVQARDGLHERDAAQAVLGA